MGSPLAWTATSTYPRTYPDRLGPIEHFPPAGLLAFGMSKIVLHGQAHAETDLDVEQKIQEK
jgi:hypothetical protein